MITPDQSNSNSFDYLNIVYLILGMIIKTIYDKIIDKFVSKTNQEFCVYSDPGLKEQTNHNILVTKKFGKTIDINCLWWETVNKVKYKNGIFLYCQFGTRIENIDSGLNKRCRHTKIKYQKSFKLAYKFKIIPKY